MPAPKTALPAVLVAVFLAVTGCAGSPTPPVVHPVPVSTDVQALDFAERMLLAGCMREAGFDYPVTARPPSPPDLGYVLTDVEWAQAHGYGGDLRKQIAESDRGDPGRRYFEHLSPARRAAALVAMNGETPDGLEITTPEGVTLTRNPGSCVSRAQQQLYGDLAAWFTAKSTTDFLDTERVTAVESDAGYRAAAARWSGCMAGSGYRFPDPQRLHSTLPDAEHPMPREREVAMAVTEARCAGYSGLGEVAARLDARFAARSRTEYPKEIADYDTLRANALPRAWALVRESEVSTPNEGER